MREQGIGVGKRGAARRRIPRAELVVLSNDEAPKPWSRSVRSGSNRPRRTETEVIGPEGRHVADTAGGPHVRRLSIERAATQHTAHSTADRQPVLSVLGRLCWISSSCLPASVGGDPMTNPAGPGITTIIWPGPAHFYDDLVNFAALRPPG